MVLPAASSPAATQPPPTSPGVRDAKGTSAREVNPSDTDDRIETFTGKGNEHLAYYCKDAKVVADRGYREVWVYLLTVGVE